MTDYLYNCLKKLYPICRSLTGNSIKYRLKYLKVKYFFSRTNLKNT